MAPRYDGDHSPQRVSGWVVLAVAVPVFLAALCGGLLAVGGLLWWVYADFDLPAPDDDPPPKP